MKINLNNWNKEQINFYCDGVEIDKVVEADDVEGYVDFIEVGKDGYPIITNNEVSIKRIYGAVLIQQELNGNT